MADPLGNAWERQAPASLMDREIVLLRQALDQAAVDLRGIGADLDGEMREFVFDTACPRIRDAIAESIRRVGLPDWAVTNVAAPRERQADES
jgi:hypothetical protein